MKTFDDFLKEDFNSPGATNFSLDVLKNKKSLETIQVFYEKVNGKLIDIKKYMTTFSGNANEIMKNDNGDWRGVVFISPEEFDIFVWKASILHTDVMRALDSNKNKKYSVTKCLMAYNDSVLATQGDVPKVFCFPFFVFLGEFGTNLSSTARSAAKDQISRIKA